MIRIQRCEVTERDNADRYHGFFYIAPYSRLGIAEVTYWLEKNCLGTWDHKADEKLLLVIFTHEIDYQSAKSYFKAEYSIPSFGVAVESFLVR